MIKTDILVIGGSASGITAASTAKSNNPEKSVTLLRKTQKVLVPCGIPYIFGTLENSDKDVVPDSGLINAGIDIIIGEAVSINKADKYCLTEDGEKIYFGKLIIGTGSLPWTPQWLKGTELDNVFVIPKDKEYIDTMLGRLHSLKEIVVIGGGFIGVEMSDELNKRGKDVTLIEICPDILPQAFDKEFAALAQKKLSERGVKVRTGIGAGEIVGNGAVSGLLLDDGTEVKADAVILSMGYRPNVELAKKSGIKITEKGFIAVDEYMRTDDADIFAVGDCAEKRDFITRKHSSVMLASVACAEARVAAMNLYKLSTLKTIGGTIAIFSTAIGDMGFGSAGLTEQQAMTEGFDVAVGFFEGIDRHPGTLADVSKQAVKLIVARESGVILGGEVYGGLSVGELINVIGFIIQNRMTLNAILTAQIGTHPLLNAAPTAYPLIKAAEAVAKNLSR